MTTTAPTAAEITLEKAAKKQMKTQKREQLLAFAKDMGCEKPSQAKMLRRAVKKYFEMGDDGLKFKGLGGKLVDPGSPQCKEFISRKFDFLLGNATADGPNAMADLVEAARTNLTARGRLLVSLNGNEKAMNALLAEKPAVVEKKSGEDRARGEGGKFLPDKSEKNPWRAGQWHLTEQMRIFKQDPKLAERLAAGAGVHVGAARPAKEA